MHSSPPCVSQSPAVAPTSSLTSVPLERAESVFPLSTSIGRKRRHDARPGVIDSAPPIQPERRGKLFFIPHENLHVNEQGVVVDPHQQEWKDRLRSHASLSREFSFETKLQIIQSYTAYVRQCFAKRPRHPRWPRDPRLWWPPSHRCRDRIDTGDGCSLFHTSANPDIHICIDTGNIHICTPSQCEFLVETHEYMVCRLTAQCKPLDYDQVSETHAYDNLSREGTEAVAQYGTKSYHRRQRRSRTGPWIPARGTTTPSNVREQKQQVTPTQKLVGTVRGRYRRVAIASDLQDPNITRERDNVFRSTITTILARTEFIPTDEQLQDLVDMVEGMWCLVTQSEAYPYNSLAYDLKYHCLVVLYSAREGLPLTIPADDQSDTEEIVVIEQSQLLIDHMPKRNNPAPFHSHRLTAAERRFISFLDTCSPEALRAHYRRVRQTTR